MLANTGYQRATSLSIKLIVDGVEQSRVTMPFMEAFTYNGVAYISIPGATLAERKTFIAQMPLADYKARVTAYAAYVTATKQTDFPGLTVGVDGAWVKNEDLCPIL